MEQDIIRISGSQLYDGDYPIDLAVLSMRDFHTIKRISGVTSGELDEAFGRGDTDLTIAFGVIALERRGIKVVESALWALMPGQIQLILATPDEGEQPGDAADPQPSPTQPPSGDGSNVAQLRSEPSSSGASAVPLATTPPPTGPPESDTGSPSVQGTSAG